MEHISSELVENLKKTEAEVQEEVEQIVKIFQDFQNKVATTEISNCRNNGDFKLMWLGTSHG